VTITYFFLKVMRSHRDKALSQDLNKFSLHSRKNELRLFSHPPTEDFLNPSIFPRQNWEDATDHRDSKHHLSIVRQYQAVLDKRIAAIFCKYFRHASRVLGLSSSDRRYSYVIA